MPHRPLPSHIAETIRFKKSQYCRFADTHEWPSFRALFNPNVTVTFCDLDGNVVTENGATYSFAGIDEFVGFFSKAFETQQTIHLVGPGELEFVEGSNEREVSAVWPLIYHAASLGVSEGWSGTGGGHYHEIWRKVEGEKGWVIASLRFVRAYWKVQGLGEEDFGG
ncbi:uncharacterized protein BDV17DRAFT_269004 [Aspergillus undulatus]|uniref:uncharacterized protein n=1 Tax=Aspergillus undulatus TaxID=1810928 RepID=UPI003CCDCAAC